MTCLLWAYPPVIVGFVITLVIGIIPGLILRALGLRRASDWWVYLNASTLSSFILWILGIHVTITGNKEVLKRIKQEDGICYVSNHTSLLDIPLILGALKIRTGFVAKKEVLFIPGINLWIGAVHSIFMDRKSLRKSVRSIKKATKNIKRGISMLVFPEGTRSKTGEIAPFRHGSFRLATESGACIVPITIKGLRPAFESRKKAFIRTDCQINVGDKIQCPAPEQREQVAALISNVENSIRETYERMN